MLMRVQGILWACGAPKYIDSFFQEALIIIFIQYEIWKSQLCHDIIA